VQPGSARDCIDGLYGERLKIRLTAPPIAGKANVHLQRYLAGLFGIPRSRVRLVSGERGRAKRLRILRAGRLPPKLAVLID
jgi:uncharacterized protein (TIGR00251 family)